jgi:plasmid stabilization system protein ParE
MPRILRSDLANADLDRIWDHLADVASPAIADFVIARLFEGMQQAASHPTIYRQRIEFTGAPRRIKLRPGAMTFSLPASRQAEPEARRLAPISPRAESDIPHP